MMRSAKCSRLRSLRRAFTLVELLVAVAMMVVLLALAIPALKAVTNNRKVSEASRLVSAVLLQAQARAAQDGKPYGIWIERETRNLPPNSMGDLDDTRANYATQIYFAETPPPYSGDIVGAKATLIETGVSAGVPFVRVRFSEAENGMWPFLIKPGDLIQFGGAGAYYQILTQPVPGSDPMPTDPYPSGTFHVDVANSNVRLPAVDNVYPYSINTSFNVLRQPQRSAGEPIQLPKRTVIDLDSSGLGAFGTEFQPWIYPATGNAALLSGLMGEIYHPSVDQDSTDLHLDPLVGSGRVGVAAADDTPDDSPIVIMFQPSGRVDRVYRGVPNPANPTKGAFSQVGFNVGSTIYLLLGQDDELEEGNNLYNGDNVWVCIGHLTGSIRSAPVIPAHTPVNPMDLDDYGVSYEDVVAPASITVARERITIARSSARAGVQMGGGG